MNMAAGVASRLVKNGATHGASAGKTGTGLHAQPKQTEYEFGGPIGTGLMMIGFPAFMLWLWLSVAVNNGQPLVFQSWEHFEWVAEYVREHAVPTTAAVAFYLGYTGYQLLLAAVLPGYTVQGMPIKSQGGKRLDYLCNAPAAWVVTLATAAALHYSGLLELTWLADNYAPVLGTAMLFALAGSIALYIAGMTVPAAREAASGNPIYDTFMGVILHPRIAFIDLKLFYELRVPWSLLFFITLSAMVKQWRLEGAPSGQLLMMTLAHFLYANATHKGEEHVPCTWDITTEKFGYMLFFWNAAGVPFGYSTTSMYLLARGPLHHPMWFHVFCFSTLLMAYYVWDTSNGQKSVFKAKKQGTWHPEWIRLPPQFKYCVLENPATIDGWLLCDGWWGVARKITYTSDLVMALLWGLIAGFESCLPYWYFCFFLAVLVHRVTRNEAYCLERYGEAWKEYRRRVPYSFIPGLI